MFVFITDTLGAVRVLSKVDDIVTDGTVEPTS